MGVIRLGGLWVEPGRLVEVQLGSSTAHVFNMALAVDLTADVEWMDEFWKLVDFTVRGENAI